MAKRKCWEDVRVEACRMFYEERKTLKYIREKLASPPWNFTASERSFRYKLKKWGAMRSDSMAFLGPTNVQFATSMPFESQQIHFNGDLDNFTTIATNQYRPPTSLDLPLGASILDSGLVEYGTNQRPSNFVIYEEICAAIESKQTSEVSRLLGGARFVEGSSSVLHVAAKEEGKFCLDAIAKWVLDRHHIDMRDSQGRTALEVAIRANKLDNVVSLVEWNANLRFKNANGQQPLHVAVLSGASIEIHDVLFLHEASINTSLSDTEPWYTPANLAFDRLERSHTEAEALNWFKVVQSFLERRRLQLHKADKCAQITFCKFTELWLGSNDRQRLFSMAKKSLIHFLRRNADPTQVFGTLGGCCRSLASVAFFHSPDNSLAEIVIRACNLAQYGPDLFSSLLKSSSSDLHKSGGHSAEPYLESLLDRNVELPPGQNAICRILEESHVEGKLCLLRIITERQPSILRQLDTDPLRTINALSSVASPHRYGIAELLFSSRDQSVEQLTKFQELPRWAWSTLYTLDFPVVPALSDLLPGFLSGAYGEWLDIQSYELGSFTQCIVHVMTKRLIENTVLDFRVQLSPRDRLNIALRLRREYKLPDLHVSNDMIIDILAEVRPGGLEGLGSFS